MNCIERWKFAMKQEEAIRVIDCSSVFFKEKLNAWNYFLNNIVKSKYD
jgi:hypothetical protein